MMNVTLDFLLLVGVTIIFIRGSLFKRIRNAWPEFLNCALCTGFWIGAAGSLLLQTARGSATSFFLVIQLAVFVSVAAYVLALVLLGLDRLAGND